ncbi:MAG: RnfH family protein [Magnetococcales bacterium]|nr:RnfH family protein [Magnetococcales bacterium]
MKIAVAYAEAQRQMVLDVEVQEGVTAREAVERSGILSRFPQIDVSRCKIGIFGKIIEPDHVVALGDRLEIYRPALGKPPRKERPAKGGDAAGDDATESREADAEGSVSKVDKVAAAKQRTAAAKARMADKNSGGES